MSENTRVDIGWKQFFIRLIESLRWPAAWVIIVFLLRQPIAGLLDAVRQSLVH